MNENPANPVPNPNRNALDSGATGVDPALATTGAAETNQTGNATGNGTGQTETLLKGLLDDADRALPACTCGKPPGVGGQHKAACARRAARTVLFARPVVQSNGNDTNKVEPFLAPVVQREPVASPADFAFYGKLARRFTKRLGEWDERTLHAAGDPVAAKARRAGLMKEADELAKLIEGGSIDPADLDELDSAMNEAAALSGWPRAHPLARVALVGGDMALAALFRRLALQSTIKRLDVAIAALPKVEGETK